MDDWCIMKVYQVNRKYEDEISQIESRMYATPDEVRHICRLILRSHIFYVNLCIAWEIHVGE